jgi:hypothetical protein
VPTLDAEPVPVNPNQLPITTFNSIVIGGALWRKVTKVT